MKHIRFDILMPNIEKMKDLLFHHSDYFISNWWATFSVAFSAAIISLTIGLILSVISLKWKYLDFIMMPFVAMSQSFPLQAIAPLIIIILGTGILTKLSIAFVIAFFPIYATCINALKTTPVNLLANAYISDCSFAKELYYIRLPYALPAIIAASKIGFTLAVLGAVVAEFINPDNGLGNIIVMAQSSYNIEVIYISIVILASQGILIYTILSCFERIIINNRRDHNE